jgi:hypothetical protein
MTQMTPEDGFWNWFVQHEMELLDFDPGQEIERERLFDEVATELQKVNPYLTFEFGPNGPRREFISAAGIRDAFPAVVRRASSAPTLQRWHTTAFRPRRTSINIIEIEVSASIQSMFNSHCRTMER